VLTGTDRNWVQVGPVLRGAGSIPAYFKISHTVLVRACNPDRGILRGCADAPAVFCGEPQHLRPGIAKASRSGIVFYSRQQMAYS
jgi:hypothetical protein